MNWIRLSSEFPRHRKTLRLVRRLGKVARTYPVMLWLWAVEQSADGSLRDIYANELAVICDHEGDQKELWAAMAECGFIEQAGGGWRIAGWEEIRYRNQSWRRRRAILKPHGGEIRGKLREQVLDACGRECANCGSLGRLSVDHIIPVSRGGTNDPSNLRVLCKSCNSSKGNRDGVRLAR